MSQTVLLFAKYTFTDWFPPDHEIFRLQDELIANEGSDETFYSFLEIKPSASQDEVGKALRKRSRLLHPDKAKQNFIASRAKKPNKPKIPLGKKPKVHVNKPPSQSEIQKYSKIAQERYARLGVIGEILKGSGRERYDFFLANGFPTWRGTGYYYARYRPGLGTVLVGLFLFGGGLVHYGAMYLGWKRQREFVERYIKHARKAAWGDESAIGGIPGLGATQVGASPAPPQPLDFAQENGQAVLNRRQKRQQDKDAKKKEKFGRPSKVDAVPEAEVTAPQGAKKRVQAENGKVLIVDSMGNVFLEEENEEGETGEFLLDPSEIPKPSYRDTIVIKLPIWAYRTVQAKITGKTAPEDDGRVLGSDSTSEDEVETIAEAKSDKSSRRKIKKRA